jgi:hypothetical protein
MLYNTSGAGKTRAVFETLCKGFGLYITCRPINLEGFGSRDYEEAVARIQSQIFVSDLSSLNDPEYKKALDEENTAIVERHIVTLILSRLLVFQAFFKALPPNRTMFHYRLWLLAQTHPTLLFGLDVFAAIYSRLQAHYHSSWIPKLKAQTGSELHMELGFCYVIDEAQIPARELSKAFLDSSVQDARPMLRPLVGTLSKVASTAQLILAGTSFSGAALGQATGSAIQMDLRWVTYSDTGAFTDQAIQSLFIMRYIWPKVSGIDLLEEDARVFLSRCWRWLRGR